MASFSVKLWKTLEQLKEDDFKKFKWLLKQDNVSAAQLEAADRQDTVDLMAQKYGDRGALKETMKLLEKISRNDLAQSLQKSCMDPKDLRPQDHERKSAELQSLQLFAGCVALDPDVRLNLTLSADGKQVHHGEGKLLENPERFFRCVCWSKPRTDRQEGTKHTES